MIKRIVIAGAGLGGLVAGINLARSGLPVELFEKRCRDELGYPWEDAMDPSVFAYCSLEEPPGEHFLPYIKPWDQNPGRTVTLKGGNAAAKNRVYVDRSFLINSLIDQAAAAGVKLNFGVSIEKAFFAEKGVCAVVINEDGNERFIETDLLIDAAGIDSVIRKQLPAFYGIDKTITAADTYYAYRAIYEREAPYAPPHSYNIVFFQTGKPGLSWVIDNEKTADVLIGGFGGLEKNDVSEAIWRLRDAFPVVGSSLIAGGGVYRIPMRKTLARFTAGAYAAVGDSASMTEPLSGSGITLSMKAGKMLADTVISYGTSAAGLWRYEYRYHKELGLSYLTDDIIRRMLIMLSSDDIDFLFEHRVLTEKEMLKTGGDYSREMLFDKLSAVLRPSLAGPLAVTGTRLAKAAFIKKTIPEKYDPAAISLWAAGYNRI